MTTPTLEDLRKDPSIIEKIFFDAMLVGYASGTSTPGEPPDIPGARQISYRDGPWLVTDTWILASEEQPTSGDIIISYNTVRVWRMWYSGWYSPEAMHCLKHALNETYRQRKFVGGRGANQQKTEDGLFIYLNKSTGSFESFSGEELILSTPTNDELGWHEYKGGLLF